MLLLLIALSGCAAVPRPGTQAFLAPGIVFALPAPASLGREISADQLVTVRHQGTVQIFQAHLSVSPDRLLLIGLDPLGRRLVTVSETAAGLEVDAASPLPPGLRPENVLADIAIVYWPETAVRRALPDAATLEVGPRRRVVVADGREIIRVDYDASAAQAWNGHARYRNDAFGYELDLQSVAAGE